MSYQRGGPHQNEGGGYQNSGGGPPSQNQGANSSYQDGGGYQQQGDTGNYANINDGNAEPVGESTPHRTINVFGRVLDYDLAISKAFYFFFFGAFGSLFPLIAIYFKQLGMNAAQAGFLIGIRPFVEFASIPFWGSFADKFKRGKILLIFSLVCWIAFTVSLSYIQPGNPFCLARNSTHAYLTAPQRVEQFSSDYYKPVTYQYVKPGLAPVYITEENTVNYDPEKEGTLVRPPYSSRVYNKSAVEEVFLLLLLLIILGEFFSAPAATLADACTLSLLSEQPELYGSQRIFGSLGWGLSMFFVGIALDNSIFPNHPCGHLEFTEKNYSVCFGVFTVLMLCALLAATQFSFSHEIAGDKPTDIPKKIMDAQTRNVAPEIAQNAKSRAPDFVETKGPKWLAFLKTCSSAHHIAFLFVTLWMGFGVGLVFSFLFWHLQDLGGGPTLFGIASVINHLSEVAAYFFAFRLINKYGHIKVLYLGLLCNCFRFLYVSIIGNAYLILPFEFIQGITHATVWAAATSYISLIAPEQQKSTGQGVLQALHHGIGKGIGAIVGGAVIANEGTTAMFISYAIVCLIICAGFFAINRIFKVEDPSLGSDIAGDTHALAPHGIPMNVPYEKDRPAYDPNQYTEPAPDPQQEAYDRYVSQGSYQQKPSFEALPTGPRR